MNATVRHYFETTPSCKHTYTPIHAPISVSSDPPHPSVNLSRRQAVLLTTTSTPVQQTCRWAFADIEPISSGRSQKLGPQPILGIFFAGAPRSTCLRIYHMYRRVYGHASGMVLLRRWEALGRGESTHHVCGRTTDMPSAMPIQSRYRADVEPT